MGFFISEPFTPEVSDSLLCVHCQKCRRRGVCPDIYNQALYRAARQGRATAQLLTAEADRLLETISHADDVRSLLNNNGILERVLSRALHLEMPLLDELRARQ